jgi:hypothetical protein
LDDRDATRRLRGVGCGLDDLCFHKAPLYFEIMPDALRTNLGEKRGSPVPGGTGFWHSVTSEAFGDTQLSFTVPWLALAVIAIGPIPASLTVPASQRGGIQPAVAIGVAD